MKTEIMTGQDYGLNTFTFELAQPDDDSALLEILQEMPMEGEIQVLYQSRPSYFDALQVSGREHQVIVCRKSGDRHIVGFGTRSLKQVFINGAVMNIGYLSNLRLQEKYRKGMLLSRGYRYLKALHEGDRRVPAYITTIIEGNSRAVRVLSSVRAGLPAYRYIGMYQVFAGSFRGARKRFKQTTCQVQKATADQLKTIISFLQDHGREKQFYPYYTLDDFRQAPAGGPLKGLHPEDIFLAFQGNEMVGLLARWDQREFKQIIITGYRGKARLMRPFYNLISRIMRAPTLPGTGETLHSFYIGLIAVKNNDPEIFKSLLHELYDESAATDYSFFVVGLAAQDPLCSALRDFRTVDYQSRIYFAGWEDSERLYHELDGRIPYLEVGSL
ncbi:MAG: hypothetical protein ACMUIA_02025 [bacterium]